MQTILYEEPRKWAQEGECWRKFHDIYNLLCINKREETFYRAFDGSNSTIDLTIASLTIALELEWSKEYELGGSDYFPIIIEDNRDGA